MSEVGLTPDQREYHMAEFTKLTSEIAVLVGSVVQLLNWATVSSGAIFAWLLTYHGGTRHAPGAAVRFAFAAPFLIAVVLASVSRAQNAQIGHMGAYLLRLEERIGSPDLGWERYFQPRRQQVGRALYRAWLILLTADLVFGIIGLCMVR